MCLFLSVFITSSPHSSAVIRLSDSDVFLRFQHIPCLSLTLQTKILQHMHKKRWHRSLLFSVQRVHPCLTITNCSCTFLPSFLPSSLTSDPTNWVGYHGDGPFLSAGYRVWEFGRGVKSTQLLTCTLERRCVVGEKLLEEEVQVAGF